MYIQSSSFCSDVIFLWSVIIILLLPLYNLNTECMVVQLAHAKAENDWKISLTASVPAIDDDEQQVHGHTIVFYNI